MSSLNKRRTRDVSARNIFEIWYRFGYTGSREISFPFRPGIRCHSEPGRHEQLNRKCRDLLCLAAEQLKNAILPRRHSPRAQRKRLSTSTTLSRRSPEFATLLFRVRFQPVQGVLTKISDCGEVPKGPGHQAPCSSPDVSISRPSFPNFAREPQLVSAIQAVEPGRYMGYSRLQ